MQPLPFDQNFNDAFAAHRANDFPRALAGYQDVVARIPEHYEAVNNIGVIYIQEERRDEAVMQFQSALALNPSYPLAYSNLGSVLVSLARWPEALAACAEAIRIDPTALAAISNLAEALVTMGRFAEAEAVCQEALRQAPGMQEATLNLGIARWGQDDPHNARELFEYVRAAAAQGGTSSMVEARATMNCAILALAAGDFGAGFDLYRARWRAKNINSRYTKHPEWDGAAHPFGKLIVVAEQGLGDEILYLSMLKDTVKRFQGVVVWELDTRLMNVMQNTLTGSQYVARALMSPVEYPGATHRIDAASLGKILRRSASDIPGKQYIFSKWTPLAGPRPKRIGISWRSVNREGGVDKTIPLEAWRPFVQTLHDRGYEILSLQYGDTPELAGFPQITKPTFDPRYDLDDLADALASCDHVVTVSNTTAHFAGAMARPTTVLLNDGIGRLWYWGNGTKTPWYSTIDIVRRQGRAWSELLLKEAVAIGMKLG